MTYKVPALLTALALCFFTFKYFTTNPHQEKNHIFLEKKESDRYRKTKHQDHSSHNHSPSQKEKKITLKQSEDLDKLSQFSFKKEQLKIDKMLGQYDKNKKELISIITSPDPYLDLPVSSHSLHSLKKNQHGALKVLALRKVAIKESQKKDFFKNIFNEAKDPTIKKIANAALELLKQGSQDPLKDITNGIGDLDNIPTD